MTVPVPRPVSILHWGMACGLAVLCAALLPPGPPPADGQETPAATVPRELDVVPRDAALVITVRLADFWNSRPTRGLRDLLAREGSGLREVEAATGLRVADVERLTLIVPAVKHLDSITPLVLVTTATPYDRAKVRRALKARPPGADRFSRVEEPEPGAGSAGLPAPYYLLGGFTDGLLYLVDERNLMLAFPNGGPGESEPALALLGQLLRRSPRGPLGDALARAGKGHMAVAGLNVAALSRALPAKLPPSLQPLQPLLQAQAVTATFDLGDTARLALHLEFAGDDRAREAADATKGLLTHARTLLAAMRKDLGPTPPEDKAPLAALLKQAEDVLKEAGVRHQDNRVEVEMTAKGEAALAPALALVNARIRDAGNRTQSQNNLKQMALAFHAYHRTFGTFPPAAVCDAGGKPLLSWRVAILPFIEQQNLYRQFKLDEPWDSDHNKKLLDKMPRTYSLPGVPLKEAGRTAYQLFVGKEALFDGARKPRFPRDITDGTANTLLVVEAAGTVPWTKPADIPFEGKDPRTRVGGWYGDIVNVSLCDGSVREVDPKKVSEYSFRAAITPNGGEVFDTTW